MQFRRWSLAILGVVFAMLMASAPAPAFADPANGAAERAGNAAAPEAELGLAGLVPANVAFAQPAPLPGASQVNGPYFLRNNYGDICLDADANVRTNGAKAQLWRCNGAAQQVWWLHKLGTSNKYLIQSQLTGMILDAHAPCIGINGCQVQLWQHLPGNLNQVWAEGGDSNWAVFINMANISMVLDADARFPRGVDGTKVQLWQYLGGENQQWYSS